MHKPPKVTIVDDDAPFREALSRLLGAHGMDCQAYSSAREFLAALSSAEPDCLVVDVEMPDMSGTDLQRELLRAGVCIPTVVITGRAEDAEASALSLGAAGFLTKPFPASALVHAIAFAVMRRN